ncbi:MAG: sialidase family protein [Planctomycetaceae bacterium]
MHAILLCAALLAAADEAAAPAAERLLIGFESAEIDAISKTFKLTTKEAQPPEGRKLISVDLAAYPGQPAWRIEEGEATQGNRALRIGFNDFGRTPLIDRRHDPIAREFYGVQNFYHADFRTTGVFRRLFPIDWSDWDVFRVDVRCADLKQELLIAFEDELVAPPVVRKVTLDPDRWHTVEVDLRKAAKERNLDLTKMATLSLSIVGAPDHKPGQRVADTLIDNLRLARRDAPAKLPVAKDESPHELPEPYRAESKPRPLPKLDLEPNRAPLELAKPFRIPIPAGHSVTPVGWAAAFDNDRLLVGFSPVGKNGAALQSLDGGKTWAGLDGTKEPTVVPIPENTHQCGNGDVVNRRGDVIVFTNIGCRGPANASQRLYAQRLLFTGKEGWKLDETAALVDCDLRHCNSNQSIVAGPNGWLWSAYGMVGRLGTICINASYSDDRGESWRSWNPGRTALVPGTLHSEEEGIGFGYTFEEPCIVPFEDGVAVLWVERGPNYLYRELKWSRFDGVDWTKPELIPHPERTIYNPTRPPVKAVSRRGGKELFAVSSMFPGVLRYADGKWSSEALEVAPRARLAVAGDEAETVLAIGPVTEKQLNDEAPVVFTAWQRKADGTWSARELAREEKPLSFKHENQYAARPGYVVQPYAPASFVPLAWTCEGDDEVRFLRVPVE